jgi:glyoxalase family protein
MELKGIHHVSVITADAKRNFEFYTREMGLRLVKKTVNQDDTSSYHLFYGDERGNPGTELTFFDIPYAGRTHPGRNSISSVALRVGDDSALQYWRDRLTELNIAHEPVATRAGRASIALRDPDGLELVLVSDEGNTGVAGGNPWDRSPVPPERGILGLGPVTLTVRDADRTARTLTDVLGFREAGQFTSVDGHGPILVFATGEGGTGAEVHLAERPDLEPEKMGRGGVHHVAFRVPTSAEHMAWLERLTAEGFRTSGLVDRFYFQSIYFRERNGILFELATDGPGFATDEDIHHLGEQLALPPFLEPRRASIEAGLQPLNTASR